MAFCFLLPVVFGKRSYGRAGKPDDVGVRLSAYRIVRTVGIYRYVYRAWRQYGVFQWALTRCCAIAVSLFGGFLSQLICWIKSAGTCSTSIFQRKLSKYLWAIPWRCCLCSILWMDWFPLRYFTGFFSSIRCSWCLKAHDAFGNTGKQVDFLYGCRLHSDTGFSGDDRICV